MLNKNLRNLWTIAFSVVLTLVLAGSALSVEQVNTGIVPLDSCGYPLDTVEALTSMAAQNIAVPVPDAGTEHHSVLVPPKPIFSPQTSITLGRPSLQSNKQGSSSFEDEFQRPSGRKSTTKAMLLSLLLPGAGELYAGNGTGSRIFLGLEGSIWAGFFAFRTYGAWKKTDYKGFAALHAGLNLDSKTDDYFENITYYDTRDQYNQFARLYHGSDATIYPENDFWNWNWDSQDSKGRFRQLRNQSKSAYRRAVYMVGLAALNRVVSVLDAARSVKRFNRKLGSEFSSMNPTGFRFSLDANPFGSNPHYYFKIKKRF